MIPPPLQPKEEEKMARQNAHRKPPMPWFKQSKLPWFRLDQVLIGGAVVAAVGLVLTQPKQTPLSTQPDPNRFCQEIVQPKAALSREQLAQLLAMPERVDRKKVQAVVKEPYCKMPSLSIRSGAMTERVAYPMVSDPQTWLVVLYEENTYVGYGFKRP